MSNCKRTGWSIANSKASSDGSQVADSDLTQDIGTVGKAYTIEYRVSNYSAGNITALAGSAEGTDRTANGVYTEYLTVSESTEIGVRADLNFVGDIDYVRVSEGYRLVYRNTFEDAAVTIGTSSTDLNGFTKGLGTWTITGVADEKWIRLNTASNSSCVDVLPSKVGTWQFKLRKTASVTGSILFAASVNNILSNASQNGYHLTLNGSEQLVFGKVVAGAQSNFLLTAGGYFSLDTTYEFRITRDYTGELKLYIRGGSEFAAWTLLDTTTDNDAAITGQYVCLSGFGSGSLFWRY